MGSSGGTETSKPVWAAGSQPERELVGSEYLRDLSQVSPQSQAAIQSAIDALRMKEATANAGIVGVAARGGRMGQLQYGEVGTPTYSVLAQQRLAAIQALMEHSMQKPGMKSESKGGSTSPVMGIAKIAGTAVATAYGGPAGGAAAGAALEGVDQATAK